ncbi:MAG TPA: hypothetical protein VEC37_03510 [Bacillota bacterium]|nr:hypothetical protein [Bacillota bacterium]
MMQKPYFKVIIWILSSAFFFMAAAVLISGLGPGPTMNQSMQFMTGMMQAMHQSLMGLSMTLEHDFILKSYISLITQLTIPLLIIGIVLGLLFRLRGGQNPS